MIGLYDYGTPEWELRNKRLGQLHREIDAAREAAGMPPLTVDEKMAIESRLLDAQYYEGAPRPDAFRRMEDAIESSRNLHMPAPKFVPKVSSLADDLKDFSKDGPLGAAAAAGLAALEALRRRKNELAQQEAEKLARVSTNAAILDNAEKPPPLPDIRPEDNALPKPGGIRKATGKAMDWIFDFEETLEEATTAAAKKLAPAGSGVVREGAAKIAMRGAGALAKTATPVGQYALGVIPGPKLQNIPYIGPFLPFYSDDGKTVWNAPGSVFNWDEGWNKGQLMEQYEAATNPNLGEISRNFGASDPAGFRPGMDYYLDLLGLGGRGAGVAVARKEAGRLADDRRYQQLSTVGEVADWVGEVTGNPEINRENYNTARALQVGGSYTNRILPGSDYAIEAIGHAARAAARRIRGEEPEPAPAK